MQGASSHIKFSIIIPCYNSEQTLEAALRSCLDQSISPHEIILIDDHSSDNTSKIINEFSAQYPIIKSVFFTKNKGVSSARNAGWNLATGDYIAFLDSDDSFAPNKLEIIEKYITLYGEGAYWHHYTVNSSVYFSSQDAALPRVRPTSFFKLLWGSPVATCTLIIPRHWSLRFDENMRYCEDHDFILRLSYTKPLTEIPIILTSINRKINSPGGLSGQIWQMRTGEMYMYHKLHRLNKLYIFIQPFLYIYSLLKHLRLLARRAS